MNKNEAICVLGQKIKDASELDMDIRANEAELKALINEITSLIGKAE